MRGTLWHRVTAALRGLGKLCLLTIVLVPATSTALAQTVAGDDAEISRSVRLEATRRAKATETAEVTEPEPKFLESKLYWFDNQYVLTRFLSGWKGVHYSGGDFPTGSGLKFGVGFTDVAVGTIYEDEDQPNRVDLDAVAAYSTRGYLQTAGSVAVRNLGGVPVHLAVQGGYVEFPQEDFFGLGPNTLEANRSNYLLESIDVGLGVEVEPTTWLRGGVGLSHLDPSIGVGTDSRFPSTRELFDPTGLPGFLEQPDFRRTDAWVEVDWRDNPLLPRAGGFYRLALADYHDEDLGRHDFRQVEATLSQYVPLGGPHRTLALQASAVVSDTDSGQQVPFFYQPTLGGRQRLRGFREFRFRDRNSLLLTAEYRWEAWWALDGALFVDAGKVARDSADLDLSDLEATYGFGFRFHSNDAYSIRVDLGFSREGFIPFFTGSYGF